MSYEKQIYYLTIILCLSLVNNLISQDFNWIYSTAYYGGERTATCNQNGNLYCAGEFIIDATFCDTTITTSNNTANIFFVKFDSEGNCIWVKNIGSTLFETCFEVACNDNDDVYITGMFDGTVSFGDFALTTAGLYDIFLAKYSPSGECLWVIQAGGESFFDHAITLDFDSEDNVYITGCFENTATFGDTVVSSGIPSGGNPNVEWGGEIFVAKYTTNGAFVWIKNEGDLENERAYGIAIHDNKMFIAGYMYGNSVYNNEVTLTSNGEKDIFIACYDTDGDNDVFSASYEDNKIAWYENIDGNGNFIQHIITTSANGAYCVYSCDIDGDEDNDIFAASALDNTMAWYENTDGNGTFSEE